MGGHFFYTLMIFPNIMEFIVKHLLQYLYGYELELVVFGVFIYVLNVFIVSYLLHKWFVKGEGDVR